MQRRGTEGEVRLFQRGVQDEPRPLPGVLLRDGFRQPVREGHALVQLRSPLLRLRYGKILSRDAILSAIIIFV